jgi:hypothetical protein
MRNPKRISQKSHLNQKSRKRRNLLRSKRNHHLKNPNNQLNLNPLRLLRKAKRWSRKKRTIRRNKKRRTRMMKMRLPGEERRGMRGNNRSSLPLTS